MLLCQNFYLKWYNDIYGLCIKKCTVFMQKKKKKNSITGQAPYLNFKKSKIKFCAGKFSSMLQI